MGSSRQDLRNGLPLISTESSQQAFFQSVLLLFVSSSGLKRMINLHLDYRQICIRSILMLIHKLVSWGSSRPSSLHYTVSLSDNLRTR